MPIPKEVYGNASIGFLTADITSTAVTFAVTGGKWPTGGNFTVLCDGEYMLVSVVAGTSPNFTFAVSRGQEGTTAVLHLTGKLIFTDLTAGALQRLCIQSLNGVPICNRRNLNFIGGNITITDNGTTESADITLASGTGGQFTPPPTSGWTLIPVPTGYHQTGAFSTDSLGANVTESGSIDGTITNIRGITRALPSSVTGVFLFTWPLGGQGQMGMCLRNGGSKAIETFGFYPVIGTWRQSSFANSIGNESVLSNQSVGPYQLTWIQWDGSSWSMSADGKHFVTFASTAIGADQIGFFLNCTNASGKSAIRCISWDESP